MNRLPQDWNFDRLKDTAVINGISLSANTDPGYELNYLEISNVNYYGSVFMRPLPRVNHAALMSVC